MFQDFGLVAVTKHLAKAMLRKGRLILIHSLSVQSITAGEAWLQELEAANHSISSQGAE